MERLGIEGTDFQAGSRDHPCKRIHAQGGDPDEAHADVSGQVLDSVGEGDQPRLLIASCRSLRGMVLRGERISAGAAAGRLFPENRPGSLSSPHINGVKNGNRCFMKHSFYGRSYTGSSIRLSIKIRA